MMRVGQLTQTIRELVRSRREHEWLEVKVNDLDPQKVGKYVSALANCAAIADQPYGYVVWGVVDSTFEVVGTTVDPWRMKVGNEDLGPWLRRAISPDTTDFQFQQIELENQQLIVLVIERASISPVQFNGVEYIRDGSYTKDLRRFPLKARELWKSFERTPFEERTCRDGVRSVEVAEVLNLDAYLSLTEQPRSTSLDDQLRYLAADRLIVPAGGGMWNITNLGALTLARRLDEFPTLHRKAVRFVAYAGNSRSEAVDQVDGIRGYATGFEGLLNHIDGRLPRREVTDPIRRMQEHFPRISVRELIANALIHQDLTVAGTGPLVELFQDRLEISNAGAPLLEDTRRLLDSPARSRNERLATFMRKARICEERGSGIDKVALAAEDAQLPAPEIRVVGDSTIAVLLGPRPLSQMEPAERLWATYLHAALRYVNQQDVTNATMRARFGIADRNSSQASRLLRDAVEAELIRPRDPAASRKNMRYVPFWA